MKPITINYGRRSEFIQMLKERSLAQGGLVGAEIGTDHGQYAQQLLNGVDGLRLYCIDPWLAYIEGDEVHTQEQVDEIYREAKERLDPLASIVIRDTSMNIVKSIPSNSLDFVFIDGNHSFSFVYEDIVEWTKKVKPGGIVAGHDYKVDPVNNYGVIEAVTKYVEENHIAPLFIMHKGGKLVDCWMFFKQP